MMEETMLLIITPLGGWRREIMVYSFEGATTERLFEAFQAINDMYDEEGTRDKYNITLVPITVDQVEDWIQNNVRPNWWEVLRRRMRWSLTTMRDARGDVV